MQKPTPGELLKELFLSEYGISQNALAVAIGVPRSRISDIVNGKRRIEADTAIRFSRYFGNSAQFWLNLQNQHDLRLLQNQSCYMRIQPVSSVSADTRS